jgi:hypothetical protein
MVELYLHLELQIVCPAVLRTCTVAQFRWNSPAMIPAYSVKYKNKQCTIFLNFLPGTKLPNIAVMLKGKRAEWVALDVCARFEYQSKNGLSWLNFSVVSSVTAR